MKTIFIICICSISAAFATLAQTPTASPMVSPTASASASASPSSSLESEIESSIRGKHKKHFNFTIGQHDADGDKANDRHGDSDSNDIPAMVVPLVGVIFLTVFGAPVLIVAVIMYFGFSKNRMMHRTVRMMVEKGQPVPAALLTPPPAAVRQRSDMRRGVVLMMVGLGLVVFLGASNDWENGSWAIGIIPFLIGFGYLIVWKLEGGSKPKTDNPPPLP